MLMFLGILQDERRVPDFRDAIAALPGAETIRAEILGVHGLLASSDPTHVLMKRCADWVEARVAEVTNSGTPPELVILTDLAARGCLLAELDPLGCREDEAARYRRSRVVPSLHKVSVGVAPREGQVIAGRPSWARNRLMVLRRLLL